MKKEDKALIEITCLEEGVGREVSQINDSELIGYFTYDHKNKKETFARVEDLPAFYNDGLTPLPKGWKGFARPVNRETNNNGKTWQDCVIWGDEYICKTGYKQELHYIAVDTAPLKSTDNKGGEGSPYNPITEPASYKHWLDKQKLIPKIKDTPAIDEGVSVEQFLLPYSHYDEQFRGTGITFNNAVRAIEDYIEKITNPKLSLVEQSFVEYPVEMAFNEGAKGNWDVNEKERIAMIKGAQWQQHNAGGKVSVEEVTKLIEFHTDFTGNINLSPKNLILAIHALSPPKTK